MKAKVRLLHVLVGLTCLAEAGAVAIAVGFDDGALLLPAAALHLGAVLCARRAAVSRRGEDALSQVESDLVTVTAFFVPLFGPPCAWCLPRPPKAPEAENAHELFERYEEHVRPHVPDYERTLFTGDFDKDLARELDAESYYEVLRHGGIDQKRNALRRIADMGEARHLALVRHCLTDPEQEVRLYAYSELERLSRGYEETIGECTRRIEAHPEDAAALRGLAEANFAYAASGIHDEEMAGFYFRSAARFASRAQERGDAAPECVLLEAHALARLHDYDRALGCLQMLEGSPSVEREMRLARAEIAYRRRDFAAAREEARALVEGGHETPEWLRALAPEEAHA